MPCYYYLNVSSLEFLIGLYALCAYKITISLILFLIYCFWTVVVVYVCKRLKDIVMMLEAPIRGVAPLFTALWKLQGSTKHLTPLHAEFLMLCLLAKCYKTGLSILDDDVLKWTIRETFLYLYCYYGCVAFFFSFVVEK